MDGQWALRLKALEKENTELKKMVAELGLQVSALDIADEKTSKPSVFLRSHCK